MTDRTDSFPADRAPARLIELIAGLGLPELAAEAADLARQLRHRDALAVAVFGSFKAGKSSLLNHLAAREVLPVGVVPVTAVVTRLRFGETERAEVGFLDGSRRTIGLAEVGSYVSESENPENVKKVAAVEAALPSLRPFAPLQFVDTPGLGSALAHNSEATLGWLPNVGVALLAVSCEAPLSERDLQLLAELRRHTPKTALVLTKADLVSGPERDEILAFVRRRLRRIGREDLPVFFYSVREGAADFRAGLESGLVQPLQSDQARAVEQIFRHKLLALAGRAADRARIALAAAAQADANRQSLRDRLAEERRDFPLLQAELRGRARDWSGGFFDWALAELRPDREALRARMEAELRAQFPRWRTRLPALLRAWREWMGKFLARELGEISRARAGLFQTPLRDARARLERALEAFHGRLAGHVRAALGLALSPRRFELEARQPAAPPVDVSFAFDASFEMLAAALPLSLLRPWIERSLLRKADGQLAKNLSRLVSAWRDRVAAEIDALADSAERQAADELKGFEQAVEAGKSGEPSLRRTVEELESMRAALAET